MASLCRRKVQEESQKTERWASVHWAVEEDEATDHIRDIV